MIKFIEVKLVLKKVFYFKFWNVTFMLVIFYLSSLSKIFSISRYFKYKIKREIQTYMLKRNFLPNSSKKSKVLYFFNSIGKILSTSSYYLFNFIYK